MEHAQYVYTITHQIYHDASVTRAGIWRDFFPANSRPTTKHKLSTTTYVCMYVCIYVCMCVYILTTRTYVQHVHTYDTYIRTTRTYLRHVHTYNTYILTTRTYLRHVHTYDTYIRMTRTYLRHVHTYDTYIRESPLNTRTPHTQLSTFIHVQQLYACGILTTYSLLRIFTLMQITEHTHAFFMY